MEQVAKLPAGIEVVPVKSIGCRDQLVRCIGWREYRCPPSGTGARDERNLRMPAPGISHSECSRYGTVSPMAEKQVFGVLFF